MYGVQTLVDRELAISSGYKNADINSNEIPGREEKAVNQGSKMKVLCWYGKNFLAFVLAGFGVFLFLYFSSATISAEEGCIPVDGLEFICGVNQAEDLLRMPNSNFVIASGRISDTEGQIYAIDKNSRIVSELFPRNVLEAKHDIENFGDCPGSINAFQPHGISVREMGQDAYWLYVVGHGYREAIEVFSLKINDDIPSLRWVGCIEAPNQVERFNAVTVLPNNKIAVTHLPPAGSPNRGSGEVWEWSSNEGWEIVKGSQMPGPNGIVASSDGSTLFVAAYLGTSLKKLERQSSSQPIQVETIYSIDNIRWSDEGELLLAAHDRGCTPRGGCSNSSATHLLKASPIDLEIETIRVIPVLDVFPVGTVIIDVGDEYWVGGIAGTDRIAIFR